MTLYCNKGTKESAQMAGDCVTIPRATCTVNGIAGKLATKQCGRGGLQQTPNIAAGEAAKTICGK